jgi:ribosome-binding ATPase
VESELAELSGDDKAEFLSSLGVKEEECGLRALVKEAYALLGLQTYFTSGETETRAWTIQTGWRAPQVYRMQLLFVLTYNVCVYS